jgi:LCP family protein required for cell wall assembly
MGVSAFVVLVAAAGCAWIYQLDSNIKHSALDTGSSPQKGAVIPGAMNVLIIGSDTRLGGNAALGGQDDSLPHADVEMVLHVSADHQNATVMSIPRDTDTSMPDCTQNGKTYHFPTHDQITNSLNYGPGCTVSAVNNLTGIHIDHFMMVDFNGVVNMSDAVGGVQVCTDHDVYDPGSHLKLAAGSHILVGQGALEFLRTRHAFGGASDTDRAQTQHIFLSALIHKMKSASTLADPTNVYSLAETGSKAFQVDDGLKSVPQLMSLANTLGGVPSNRITFTTMPTDQDPYNPSAWLVPKPNAQQLFDAIANDQSLTPGSTSSKPTAGATPSAAQTIDPSTVEVHVFNGTGIPGRAAAVQTELAGKGYSDSIVEHTAMSVSASKVEYSASDPKYKREAQQVASALGLPDSSLTVTPGLTTVHVVVGSDLKVGSGSGSSGSKPPANIGQATQGASVEVAGDTVQCAKASPWRLGGMPASASAYQGLTVEQAYALATKNGIPDSDKQK